MAPDRRAFAYATYLVSATLFATPVAGLALARLGVALTPALLGILGLVFGVYGLAILWLGDVYRGLLVSILVLMTVGANIPLGVLPEGVTIGPNLYVVDLPLLILVAVTSPSWNRGHFTAAQGLLVLYMVWSFLLVVLAPGPRPDVMFWYALHVARFTLVFALVTRGIVDDWISAHTALGVVVLTVVGHALVASIQAITGPVDGLTVLGMNTAIVAAFPMGPLGSVPSGPYVGGFTGGAPFVVLLTVVIPIVLSAVFHDRLPRIVALGGAAWLAFLLQLTAWDAARGALLVSLGLSVLLLGWWATGVLWRRASTLRVDPTGSWIVARWPAAVGGTISLAALVQFLRPGEAGSHRPVYLDPELGQRTARSLAIPGFDTSNLAIRIYQYVGGIDTFLQYPLTGLGGANYPYVALNYGSKALMIHNIYIGVLAETGFIGALLFFGAMGYAIRATWLVADRDDDPLFLGLFAGIGGVLALQFFQPQYLRATSIVPLWAIFGIACGHYRRKRDPSTSTDVWARAWTASRGHAGLVSARITRAVAALPGRIHAALRSRRPGSAAIALRARMAAIAASSRLLSGITAARNSSVLVCAWRRLRRHCDRSRLFE